MKEERLRRLIFLINLLMFFFSIQKKHYFNKIINKTEQLKECVYKGEKGTIKMSKRYSSYIERLIILLKIIKSKIS